MGYYTKYLSTLLRGPWATTIKERFESRRAINNLKASDKKLYKELPKLVEQEHKVTKALREEDKVIRELKEAAANGYALAFNVSTMDMKILEAVNKLIDAWERIRRIIVTLPSEDNKREVNNRFEQLNQLLINLLYKAIKKAEDEERQEYKDILIIVNESAKKEHSQFMQAVRLRFQSLESQSMLAKLAVRAEIRKERRFIVALGFIAGRLNQLTASTSRAFKKPHYGWRPKKLELISQLESITKESADDIEKAFYEAYLIKKRDFLLILKVIVNTDVIKQLNRKWVIAHFMPEEPVKKKEIGIDKIEEKIAKEFHTIAQALRISTKGLQDLKSKLARVQ